MLKRTLYRLLPPLLALLGGCGDPQDVRAREPHPAEAYTWKEWVARESPTIPQRAEHIGGYHRYRGLPNMEKWRPEDFLPEEYLKADHEDICTLPQSERQKIRPMITDSTNITASMAEKLAYAKKGVIAAQAGMAWYCHANTLHVQGDPSLGLTTADALEWARRGAASGDPDAMYRLADCMLAIETDVAVGNVDAPLDPFWADQALYWLWRSVRDGLEPEALRFGAPGGLAGYSYPTREENDVEYYKWMRLWELQAIFHRHPSLYGQHFIDRILKAAYDVSAEQRQRGERAVGEWLRKHPDIWNRIFERPVSADRNRIFCPGEAGHWESFDYEGLNRELAPYGLEASPPGS